MKTTSHNLNTIISTLIIVVLSALTLVAYLLFEERSRVLSDANQQIESITNTISRQFSEFNAEITAIRNALQPEVTRLDLQGYGDVSLIEERLSQAANLDAQLIELVLFGRDGELIASSSGINFNNAYLEFWAPQIETEPSFLAPQRITSGLSSGRSVNVVVIGFRGLEIDLGSGLALIFDQEKFVSILESTRPYEDVHVTIKNRDGEDLVERHASTLEEARHQHRNIEHTIQPSGTSLSVNAHRSSESVLSENWNQLAFLVGLIAFILILTSCIALFQLARLDRRRVEARLTADMRLQRLNAIFKAAPDAILSVSAASVIQSANESASDLLGYSVEALIGMPIEQLIPQQFHSVHQRHVERFLKNPESQTATMGDWRRVHCLTASGKEVPILASLGRLSNDPTSDTVVMIRDMSDAKIADDNLRQLSFELARELEAAKEADRAKSGFLAQMSHELRTPLNAIIGFSEAGKLELFGEISPKIYRDYAEDIHRSGLHLLSLVNDILDFSKIDANKHDIELNIFDIRPLLIETMKISQVIASENNVRLRCKNSRLFDKILADRRALHQCLLNLISNAIRHSRENRAVVLSLVATKETLEFHVIDYGVGISPDNLKKIGKPFEQFEDSMTSGRKGTGLGLAITKSLMELMRGRLEIESTEGVGTTAKLVFPKQPESEFYNS